MGLLVLKVFMNHFTEVVTKEIFAFLFVTFVQSFKFLFCRDTCSLETGQNALSVKKHIR